MSNHARLWVIAGLCVAGALGAYACVSLRLVNVQALVASAGGTKAPAPAADPYVSFDMEAYQSIMTNYWQKPSDADLSQLFQQALQKAESIMGMQVSSTTLPTQDATGTREMLASAFSEATSTDAKKQLATGILQVALYNLAPAGRDQLLSHSDEVALRQEVQNVNPASDLYSNLGLATGAPIPDVDAALKQKEAALAASSSPAAKQELASAKYAALVLSNPNTKARYDSSKIEPTIFTTVMGHTLYVNVSRMSPTTLQEFADALAAASSTPGLDSMIFDLRSNIGGDLNNAAGFLGLFIGPNQYAFDLFHQGDYNVVRTTANRAPELARYKDVAVLTGGMTQSTAEVITAALKKFRIAHVVGATTRGWGTVENTFPLSTTPDASTTYALLLVHSITLREDNQPVQGRGVDPDMSIADANWKSELSSYFHSPSLIAALKKEAIADPIQ